MDWNTTIKIAGAIAIIAGVLISYYISRRKFNRRANTGVEFFKTYEKAWLTTLIEKFGRLFALILILGGVVLIIISIF